MTADPHDDDRDDQADEPEPADDEAEHEHARPGPADMRAALDVAEAILTGADHAAAVELASAGTCPECVAVAAVSFWVSFVATAAGDTIEVSRRSAAVMLTAVRAARRDLGASAN